MSGGLLANSERQRLITSGIKISDHAIEDAVDEEFLVYTNVCCPTEKLYICYHNIDAEGAECEPSAFVASILKKLDLSVVLEPKKLSKDNAPETLETAFTAYCKALGKSYEDALTIGEAVSKTGELSEKNEFIKQAYSNPDFSIKPETAKKLFGNNLKISPSKLDVFMRCSLSYLLKYGFNVRKLQPAEFDVMQRGTIVHYVLENIAFVDKKDTYIVVGYGKDKIMDHLGNKYCYVEQKQQLGTGHAVMECAKEFIGFDGSVLITFGDMPLFRYEEMEAMCKLHAECGADCTLMTAENSSLKSWARIIRDEYGRFSRIVEGKDCTPEQANVKELFSGVMVFNSESLFSVLPEVGCANIQKEYYITEVPELMVQKGMKVETYFTKDGDDLRGINTPEDLEICESILEKRTALLV